MNQTNLLYFVIIINSIILYIYGCITFENGSNDQCTEIFNQSNKRTLQCIIQNPLTKINSTEKCKWKPFNVINVSMSNLEKMKEFFLNNNETVMTFSQLFNGSNWGNKLIIELQDLLSDSYSVNFKIDNQWITEYFGYLKNHNLWIGIYMKADDWTRVNITIHANVIKFKGWLPIDLYLQKRGNRKDCQVHITPPVLYNQPYMKERCRSFITFLDNDGNAVSSPSTVPPKVEQTTPIREIIYSWNHATNRIFKPFVPVTIRNTVYHREESSSGFWAYILSPTVVIIIILGVIIYCTIRRNRRNSIPNSYSQPVATAPAYTYNVPMYHSPAYNQK